MQTIRSFTPRSDQLLDRAPVMETTESLKRHIDTAEDLHSLVRTMKALAAVNIRQLEHAVQSLAEYQRSIDSCRSARVPSRALTPAEYPHSPGAP